MFGLNALVKRKSTMPPSDETANAIAGILSTLAKQYDPESVVVAPAANGSPTPPKISLPGPNSAAKENLESELRALSSRIQLLEARAAVSNDTFPITPNEPGVITPFPTSPDASKPEHTPRRQISIGSRDQRTLWVNNWLAARDGGNTPDSQPRVPLTEEQLGYLRDHVNKQAEQIKSQRDHIEELSAFVRRQQDEQAVIFTKDEQNYEQLKRELVKNQQANLAFQKALREIGSIITAVANGDLSKKVLIHAKELDPEITKFKRTINKMVDQLQEFAQQVTKLAREVGTEGKLGGQAVVPDVSGIWAELTLNGKHVQSAPRNCANDSSQPHGRESHESSTRDCCCHNCCCPRRFEPKD